MAVSVASVESETVSDPIGGNGGGDGNGRNGLSNDGAVVDGGCSLYGVV